MNSEQKKESQSVGKEKIQKDNKEKDLRPAKEKENECQEESLEKDVAEQKEDQSEENKGKGENKEKGEDENKEEEKDKEKPPVKPKSREELVEELKDEIENLQGERIRLVAEFDNTKKKSVKEINSIIKDSHRCLLLKILDVLDKFDLLLRENKEKKDYGRLLKDLEKIHQKLMDLLKKGNVNPVDSVGKEFDPNMHDAVMQMASNDHKEGIIMHEIQKAYKLEEKIIRHAKVVVSKGTES